MNEAAMAREPLSPAMMDTFWERGWRHFGPMFFRYSGMESDGRLLRVIPLRINLGRFRPSESQRRTLRRNGDLKVSWGPPVIDGVRKSLFAAHASRFDENRPDSLATFLGEDPSGGIPCGIRELALTDGSGRLLAASYAAVGRDARSSIYAMFDPSESRRGLGTATLLMEIEAAREAGCRWLYHGYACREASHYDYKKGYSGLEWYDWTGWNDSPVPREE